MQNSIDNGFLHFSLGEETYYATTAMSENRPTVYLESNGVEWRFWDTPELCCGNAMTGMEAICLAMHITGLLWRRCSMWKLGVSIRTNS